MEATRRILARPGNDNRHIIAVTARAFEENRVECLDAGCCEHLSKPLDSECLLSAFLTRWVEQYEYDRVLDWIEKHKD